MGFYLVNKCDRWHVASENKLDVNNMQFFHSKIVKKHNIFKTSLKERKGVGNRLLPQIKCLQLSILAVKRDDFEETVVESQADDATQRVNHSNDSSL